MGMAFGSQVIQCQQDGTVVKSTDNFFIVPKGMAIKDAISFSGSRPQAGLILVQGRVYDLQLSTSAGNTYDIQLYSLSLQALDTRLETFVQQALCDTRVEDASTPGSRLLEVYRGISRPTVDDVLIPFKLEHVQEAISTVFEEAFADKDISLSVCQEFTCSFIVGGRDKILGSLLLALSACLQVKEGAVVTLRFSYIPEAGCLHVRILEPGGLFLLEGWEMKGAEMWRDYPVRCEGYTFESQLEVKVQNFPYLFDIAGGDEGLVKEILETILQTVEGDLVLLNLAYDRREWEELARLAHKIKPNLKSMERVDLSEVLQEMEQHALHEDDEAFSGLYLYFSDQMKDLLAAFDPVVNLQQP